VKVAVTGASGFVGGAICRALAEGGDEVVPLVRRAVPQLPKARIVARFDRDTLGPALVGCDAVIHAAAVIHRRSAKLEEYVAFNVGGTEALCEASRDAGVRRLVLLSSVKVYGEGPFEREGRVTEETETAGEQGYAGTKLTAERVVTAHEPDFADGTCIFRLVPVYGVGDKGNVRSMIVNAARRTLAVPGPGLTQKSIVHVQMVAKACARAVHASHRGVYILADPHAPTMRELADSIASSLGKRRAPSVPIAPFLLAARVVDKGLHLLRRPPQDVEGLVKKSQFRTVFDPSKYERTFGETLHVDLDASIREEVAWLRHIGTIR